MKAVVDGFEHRIKDIRLSTRTQTGGRGHNRDPAVSTVTTFKEFTGKRISGSTTFGFETNVPIEVGKSIPNHIRRPATTLSGKHIPIISLRWSSPRIDNWRHWKRQHKEC